jgi:hypothetical protein
MNFLKYDLGNLGAGDTVVVNLRGSAANVRLLTPNDFQQYKAGRRHRYSGGHVTRSPFRIPVPHGGHWIVAIDAGGLRANVTANVHVLRNQARILPTARSAPSPITDIGRHLAELREQAGVPVEHDVFLSHATEDKDDIARPLRELLEDRGLSVWIDEVKLKVGDHLRRSIDRALVASRFAVVVLSPAFFAKQWTQYELDGLVAREMGGEQLILPIWHRLTREDLLQHSPSLTDRIALSTANLTLEQIADEIAVAVAGPGDDA